MANNLFKPGAETAQWANVYCNELNVGTDITAASDLNCANILASGTIQANIIATTGATGLVDAQNLLLAEDDNAVTWSAAGNDAVAATALKGELAIDVSTLTIATGETYQVRWQNANISAGHRAFICPKYPTATLSAAQILLLNSELNIEMAAGAGEAQFIFTNVSAGNLAGGAFGAAETLIFNVLIC